MLEERRLAGAVGADEAVDLSRGGAEGHVIERVLSAERSREVVDVDDCLSHAYLLTSFFRRFGAGSRLHGRPAFPEHP